MRAFSTRMLARFMANDASYSFEHASALININPAIRVALARNSRASGVRVQGDPTWVGRWDARDSGLGDDLAHQVFTPVRHDVRAGDAFDRAHLADDFRADAHSLPRGVLRLFHAADDALRNMHA